VIRVNERLRTIDGHLHAIKGSMATIGRKAAVAEIGKLHLSGFMAWMAWLVVHIFFLIGFRNRFAVLFNWAWSYFTYQRGARLITGRKLSLIPHKGARENEGQVQHGGGEFSVR
jgi:NADH dehydrogenase